MDANIVDRYVIAAVRVFASDWGSSSGDISPPRRTSSITIKVSASAFPGFATNGGNIALGSIRIVTSNAMRLEKDRPRVRFATVRTRAV